MPHHLAVAAILAGDEPGDVYADDAAHLRAAVLVGCNDHRVYLAGAADDADFNAGVAALLEERRGRRAPFAFVVYHDGRGWERTVAPIVPGATTVPRERRFLRLTRGRGAPAHPVPAGMIVRRIDAALLGEGLEHADELVEEICSESPSVDAFLARKAGYCVQQGAAIAGFCCSEYDHAGRCELGVTTLPPYRRRGVATAAAAATIGEAFRRGATEVGWHCWTDNAASLALAATLGFELIDAYRVWLCHWPG